MDRHSQRVDESEAILEFIRGEIDSSDFGIHYRYALDQIGRDRSDLIDNPDISIQTDNTCRRTVLSLVRGYPAGRLLFLGFPTDVAWSSEEWTVDELSDVMYLYESDNSTWVRISETTRRVADGARNVATDQSLADLISRQGLDPAEASKIVELAKKVRSIRDDYDKGKDFGALFIVEHADQAVLLEGNSRATAFVLAGRPKRTVRVFVGRSAQMTSWVYFGVQ
jgi:hypothetical protein